MECETVDVRKLKKSEYGRNVLGVGALKVQLLEVSVILLLIFCFFLPIFLIWVFALKN